MTNFKEPVTIGLKTGLSTSDTRGQVVVAKHIPFSATDRTAITRTIPANSALFKGQVVITSAVAGIAAGVTVRIGDGTTIDEYGTIAVSAEGVYDIAFDKSIVSAGTTITFDATAQASAADLTTITGEAQILYFTKV